MWAGPVYLVARSRCIPARHWIKNAGSWRDSLTGRQDLPFQVADPVRSSRFHQEVCSISILIPPFHDVTMYLYWNPTSYFGHFSQIKEYFLNAYDLGELIFTAIIGNQFCSILQTCQAYAYNFFLPTALLQMSSISTGVPIVFGCLSSSIWHTQPASTLTR